GQAAFFGLGAYGYAIAVINFGDSTVPILIAMALPALFAAAFGYFLFYGRLSDVYLGVMTLVATLILFKLISSTGGSNYKIGAALLGGYNGIPGIPPINLPGNPKAFLGLEGQFYFATSVLILVYFGLRALLASDFGRVVVAIRENELRAELLGYDIRRYKLTVFVLGAVLAGLAGCLYAVWGGYVSPDVFGLAMTAQILMWIIVGGIGTLIGPVVGAFLLQILITEIGALQVFNSYLVLGVVLIVFVSFAPQGIIPLANTALSTLVRRLGRGVGPR
ncbi:MAG TPA: branched-chain amino acid ABC transporter permease, partial [Gammaproteobacteria bacterium]|nr:branched-chain amino acid ABC transporter permease [Gammaproteobacteria bacterium]